MEWLKLRLEKQIEKVKELDDRCLGVSFKSYKDLQWYVNSLKRLRIKERQNLEFLKNIIKEYYNEVIE